MFLMEDRSTEKGILGELGVLVMLVGTLLALTWGIPQNKIVWIKVIKQNILGLKTRRRIPQNISHECVKIRKHR